MSENKPEKNMRKKRINDNIKEILRRQGHSIKWLADEIGIKPSTMYTYLNRYDAKKIDYDFIVKIANVLGVDDLEILEGKSIEQLAENKLQEFFNEISDKYWFTFGIGDKKQNPYGEWYQSHDTLLIVNEEKRKERKPCFIELNNMQAFDLMMKLENVITDYLDFYIRNYYEDKYFYPNEQ